MHEWRWSSAPVLRWPEHIFSPCLSIISTGNGGNKLMLLFSQNLENRVKLFRALEAVPNCHTSIVNTFMDAIMDKINVMVSSLIIPIMHG